MSPTINRWDSIGHGDGTPYINVELKVDDLVKFPYLPTKYLFGLAVVKINFDRIEFKRINFC